MVTTRATVDLLRGLPLFSQVDHAYLESIGARTRSVTLPRHGVLFHQGQAPDGFFIVVDGLVKLSVSAADGAEKVVEMIAAGESFGEAVMFLHRPYPVTASALEPTRVLAVPEQAVTGLLEADPMFARAMLAGLSVRLHGMVRDVGQYALRSGSQRVASFLVERAGVRSTVVLGASKQVIASRLSLTPETFSRVLRDLADAGLVSVHGRRIVVLDPAGLAARTR